MTFEVPPKSNNASRFSDVRYVNPARTLMLCAAGALIGLGIAGYGLFTATGTTTALYPAEDAAIVNGVPILRVDLTAQISALYNVSFDQASKAQRTRALNDMIREELYVQRGVELGMPSDDVDVRTTLVGAAEAQTVSQELTSLPSADALAAYYAAHRDHYASEGVMNVSDWLVPQSKANAAADIVAKLRAAAAPEALGLARSRQFSAEDQFYFAAHIHLGDAAFAVATKLPSGGVSRPINTNGQVHILMMHHNAPPIEAPYVEVKARVLTDYTDDLKKRVLADNTRFLLGRARISIAPGLQ